MIKRVSDIEMSGNDCPYCGGATEVRGFVDDVEFIFPCPCAGGNYKSVEWLLGMGENKPVPAPSFIIIAESPMDENWQERDLEMIGATGHPPYSSGSTVYKGVHRRKHEWIALEFDEATKIKESLETVPNVVVFLRER